MSWTTVSTATRYAKEHISQGVHLWNQRLIQMARTQGFRAMLAMHEDAIELRRALDEQAGVYFLQLVYPHMRRQNDPSGPELVDPEVIVGRAVQAYNAQRAAWERQS